MLQGHRRGVIQPTTPCFLRRGRQDRKPSVHSVPTAWRPRSYPRTQALCPPSHPGQAQLLQVTAKEWRAPWQRSCSLCSPQGLCICSQLPAQKHPTDLNWWLVRKLHPVRDFRHLVISQEARASQARCQPFTQTLTIDPLASVRFLQL